MKNRESIRTLALVVLSMITASGLPLAAQNKPGKIGPPAPQIQTKVKPAGGSREGIKVHGHWVIEVRNPDGTLASRSEFENALQPGGGVALTRVLLGFQSVRNWRLIIVSTTASLCPSHQVNTFFPGSCEIVPASFADSTPGFFKNLTAAAIHPNDDRIELKGNFTAEAGGTVDVVHSEVDMAVMGSTLTDSRVFTSKTLAPVDQKPVAAGQIVQVTLIISFS